MSRYMLWLYALRSRSYTAILCIIASLVTLALHICCCAADDASHVGMNYALALQKNPLDTNVAAKLLSASFPSLEKAKLFGSDDNAMQDADALLNAGIKKIAVAVPQYQVWNGQISAVDGTFAKNFVESVVKPLKEKGAKVSIAVGNEPFAYWHATPGDVLLSAYRNIRDALLKEDLKESVEMMVPFQFGIFDQTYPPTAAIVREEFVPAIEELLQHMYDDGDPFEVNIYPYFAFRDNSDEIPLDYALGTSASGDYGSLFEAMHASARAALLKLHSNFVEENLIVVGEVGWPTEDKYFPSEANGWRNDTGFPHANVENAEIFITNVLSTGIPVYLFEAFDEQAKSTDSGAGTQFSNVENHWGIYTEAGTLKYDIPLLMQDPGTMEQFSTDLEPTEQPSPSPGTTEQPSPSPGTTEQPSPSPGTTDQPSSDPGTTGQPSSGACIYLGGFSFSRVSSLALAFLFVV